MSPGELCGFVSISFSFARVVHGGASELDRCMLEMLARCASPPADVVQVDTMMSQLETRFDEFSEQML